jgi:dipeptidyl-peptidase-3
MQSGVAGVSLALLCGACGTPPSAPPAETGTMATTAQQPADRQYLLETVDDATVAQLYADGFESLSLREKTLIWHLYQAALAGRDIFIDQRYEHALEMRSLLEAVVAHPQGIDAATLAEVERYTKLFWVNNGPHNNLTSRKFLLKTSPAAFAAAVRAAVKNGAPVTPPAGETLDAMLTRLAPMFFDASVDPIVTNKAPGPGQDIVLASANNLYSGVSLAEAEAFKTSGREKNGLNSRLVKRNGRLVEEVFKVGGRYSKEISAVVSHLEAALPFAPEPTANALKALIQWYRTGDDADRAKYDIAWVADKDSTVDTINGFIEVYLDARGVKGGWEGVVFYVNKEKTARIRKFADNAQWFEDHMPFEAKYRKPDVKGIVAKVIEVVMEAGDAGPVTPVGINLPNDQKIREDYGSKSVSLSNVREAGDKAAGSGMRVEFSWSPEEAARTEKYGILSGELHTDMHEVIGHASGRQADGFTGTPQGAIKEHFSALEEGRADLIGLYFIADPKLVELGILPAAEQEAIARAQYEAFTRNALQQLRRVREGTQIEEDHMRNRQMIVRWLMANTKAIDVRQRDGKTYYVMVDPKAFRDGVGRLLAEVQRIKSEGDYKAAAKLFDEHGIHFDAAIRDEVVRRVDALKLTSYTGFVMPTLTPVRDASGAITDVQISYPLDLKTQMLEYSGAN